MHDAFFLFDDLKAFRFQRLVVDQKILIVCKKFYWH